MLYRLALAALLICVPPMALPRPDAQATEADTMRFELVREGPAEACAPNCREWIAATGPITTTTAKDFQTFVDGRDLRGMLLVLDSGGGSVLASLELGRRVREYGIRTTVGRTVKLFVQPAAEPKGEAKREPPRARLSPRGECASMCVFVLLGGVQRVVPPEARILVHQIWPGSKRHDASAESYSAEEIVRVQRDVGRIARYTVEMGGDIELFELAMRIPPWERLRALTPAELRRLRLQTLETAADAPTSGAVTLERPSRHAPVRIAHRGWSLSDEGGAASLVRRHVLTVEGEEIGHFELALACGEPGGPLKLAYRDARATTAEGVRLAGVDLLLAGERLSLTIEGSGMAEEGHELRTQASVLVEAALVAGFSSDAQSVMVVGTRTTDNRRTSIRLGGTGLAKIYPGFAAGCGKASGAMAAASQR